ncbi:unnamed protein product, partial [Arctogadus glacialis]
EALADVASALQHGYPPHLRPKLEGRRGQCLGRLSEGRGAEPKDSGGEDGPHDDPSPSEHRKKGDIWWPPQGCSRGPDHGRPALQLRPRTRDRGPQRDAGEEEPGGGGVLRDGGRRCHRCLRETLSALPCEGCCYSRYCSEACRQGAREEHHRWECPVGAGAGRDGADVPAGAPGGAEGGCRENVQRARKIGPGTGVVREPKLPDAYPMTASPATANATLLTSTSASTACSITWVARAPSYCFLCAVTVATLFLKLRRAGPPPTSWGGGGSPLDENLSQEDAGWLPEHWLLEV